MLQTVASCTHCCDALCVKTRQAMVLSVVLVMLLMVIPTQGITDYDQHCSLESNTNDTIRCLVPGKSPLVFCTSECHNQSGECLHGCVEGWYGLRCSSPCSAGCSGGRCDAAGACVDGCRPGYVGRDCQPCDRCRNHTCSQHTGSCVDECITGYYGEFCNHSCEVCREGICDQMTGACVNGCDVSERGCKPSCTSNCSRDYCLHAQTCDTDSSANSKVNGVYIGLTIGCVVFILAILVSNYICYRKGLAAWRETPTDDAEHAVAYQSWHKYYEIEEEDMDGARQIQHGCQGNSEEEPDLVMPVIADVLPAARAIVHRGDDMSSESSASPTSRSYDPEIQNGNFEDLHVSMSVIADVFPAAPAIVHRGDDTSSESTSSSSSRSYTHLIREVVTEDPRTCDSYISPVEDVVLPSDV